MAQIPGLADLWAETLGDPSVCVALLDGPIDRSHPALAGTNVTEADVLGRGGVKQAADARHGTQVAAILFGRHDGPVHGIVPQCRGLAIPIYAGSGAAAACTQDELAQAIREAARLGASVIAISGGELHGRGGVSPALRTAVLECAEQRRLIVAAAGNDGCRECLQIPGALPAVLAVGAMDAGGEPLGFSNWGGPYQTQGVLALGANVEAEGNTGTSFATPVVAGVAALLLSLERKRGEAPDPLVVREAILASAQGCGPSAVATCDRLLAGRLNIAGARSFITNGAQRMSQVLDMGGPESPPIAPSPPIPPATRPAGFPSTPDVRPPESQEGPSGVQPAGCGCGCKGGNSGGAPPVQYVYAVGQLGIDFVSRIRQDSLQENFDGIHDPADEAAAPRDRHVDPSPDLQDPINVLRYLLGHNFPQTDIRGKQYDVGENRLISNGRLHDIDSFFWLLKQDNCPLYAIRPQGLFAEQAYKQLLIFFIEQIPESMLPGSMVDALAAYGIRVECLEGFFRCFGGSQENIFAGPDKQPLAVREAERAATPPAPPPGTPPTGGGVFDPLTLGIDLFDDQPSRAGRVAIAGTICGTVRLYSGEEVEVINPVMRGMSNWNSRQLVRDLLASLQLGDLRREAVTLFVMKILARLKELVRNPGKAPTDRAGNFFATTQLVRVARTLTNPSFLSMLGATRPDGTIDAEKWSNVMVDALTIRPATCVRYGSEPYDVELSFFNFANQYMGTAVLAQTIDVSDVVPVSASRVRVFPRR